MIRVTDKYFIDADKDNIILKEKKIVTKGKTAGQVKYEEIGYYPNIQYALTKLNEKFKKEMISNNEFSNIENAIIQLESLQRDFAQVISGLNIEIKAVDKCTSI